MSPFYDTLDEYLGEDASLDDIRVVVRRLWFYDFDGVPLRLWQGQGKLFTTDENEWLGSMTGDGADLHQTPSLQDGRDGTSATYNFTLNIPDLPGEPARDTFDKLRNEQWRVNNRALWCYHAIFKVDEKLRPSTPIAAFKELTMLSSKFSDKIESDNGRTLAHRYRIIIVAKDLNFGRSNKPNGTYTDTMQKRRASEVGVSNDRGCEFIASLANKTFIIP